MLNVIKRQLAVVAICGLSMTACKKDDSNNPTTPPPPANNITLKQTSLGQVLTDSVGKTLYFFTRDTTGNSVCTGGCRTTWPVFYAAQVRVPEGLQASDFATITRPDGDKQTTYKGWPLYYYNADAVTGDVKGENVGKVWYVAKADYTIMLMNGQLVGHDTKHYNSTYAEGDEIVQYFTDAAGRTLYAFKNDRFNKNNYTKSDFSNNTIWPIYETAALKSIPSVLTATDFTIIDIFGRKQLTYKGNPLYYFGQDAQQRGKNKGISFPQPGIWPIVNLQTQPAAQP